MPPGLRRSLRCGAGRRRKSAASAIVRNALALPTSGLVRVERLLVRIRLAFQPLRIRILPAVEFTTYLSQVALNRDVLVGIPGEAFAEFGLALKEKGRAAGFEQVFKFGLTNGSIGYLLPRAGWLKHEYESLVSAAGIDLGPFVVDNSIALMEKLAAAR